MVSSDNEQSILWGFLCVPLYSSPGVASKICDRPSSGWNDDSNSCEVAEVLARTEFKSYTVNRFYLWCEYMNLDYPVIHGIRCLGDMSMTGV